jgi:hypothetical protein
MAGMDEARVLLLYCTDCLVSTQSVSSNLSRNSHGSQDVVIESIASVCIVLKYAGLEARVAERRIADKKLATEGVNRLVVLTSVI